VKKGLQMKIPKAASLLQEQLAYYRSGASEYDAANRWLAQARGSAVWEEAYRREYSRSVEAVEKVAAGKDVLELAGGTGMYTERLARCAAQLTVVDGSAESLEISRSVVNRTCENVTYIVADLFEWQPPRRYDVVIFAFWLCHVPFARFDGFWTMVEAALGDSGVVTFVDVAAGNTNTQSVELRGTPSIFIEQRLNAEIVVRKLADGRRFRIVRVEWERSALRAELEMRGWSVELLQDSSDWLIGSARRSRTS
jgi:cyclopropane fatty-acyl-phospholipid synthase-like methyltransferase